MALKVCSMFSGGKDSTYALHWAFLKGFEVKCLVTLRPRRPDSWMFHVPNLDLTEYQAKALGLPRLLVETSGVRGLELVDLRAALTRAMEAFGIVGIVTGALLSDYQRMNINLVAHELGLRVYSPLWRVDQERYLIDLVRHGFRFMLVSISVMGLPPSLLGKVITEEDAKLIIESARRYGFNPALEGGEGETFVVDAPLFRFELVVKGGHVVKEGPYSWTYVINDVELREKGARRKT